LAFTFASLLRDAGADDSLEAADDLRVDTQHLTCLFERKLAALEELNQSLLHQAFSGEL
jgi:type I restriction enzyme S subunit